jgi:hypothetical protein
MNPPNNLIAEIPIYSIKCGGVKVGWQTAVQNCPEKNKKLP